MEKAENPKAREKWCWFSDFFDLHVEYFSKHFLKEEFSKVNKINCQLPVLNYLNRDTAPEWEGLFKGPGVIVNIQHPKNSD